MRGCVVLFVASSALASAACASDPVSYSRHIQPIFAEHCLQCHGPDAEKREADLRLDVAASATGSVIAAGEPDASELWARITSTDPDLRMPPGDDPPLEPGEIELIGRWIAAGARYEKHWAFEPIRDATPPGADERSSDIDRFIRAKLAAKDLTLSEPATRQQLIRRAAFDLTGLPPTWDEVNEFLNDQSPQAFEKVVDRFLASEAYGERWGRHWLDIARYADTHGGAAIGFEKFAFSYTYRDYVIAAFHNDLPYDQFVMEQLAADQLDLAENAEQLAAVGFLTVGMQFRSQHDTYDDQIDVITRGLMGLTVSCARCHDHKFDAISTKDYYSLHAVVASSEPPLEQPLLGEPPPSEQFQAYASELERLKTVHADMARDQSEVMRSRLRMQVGLYLREIARHAPEPDLSITLFSYRTDDIRPAVLQRWQRYMAAMSADDPVFGPWVQLASIENSEDFAAQCAARTAALKQENGELPQELHRVAVEPPRWNPRVLDALASHQPASMLEVADAYGELFAQVHREWLQTLLETSLEATPGAEPVPDEHPLHRAANSAVDRQLRRHLHGPGTPTNMDDALAATLLNRPIHDNVNARRGAIHQWNLTAPGSPPRAMVLRERPDADNFRVLERGNPLQRGEPVVPRFLSELGGSDAAPFPAGKRRLALARAIVDPANPLTRRVIVNWVWQHHFGRGLVRTPDDFGVRGDAPTHPELLDYLAARLLDDKWSLKKLHRRIMLTEAYQQAARERTDARRIDPENRLLWRMPRTRLELEAMRDAMLVASGELTDCEGGRPFELLSNPIVPHRSVYAFVNRDIVAPLMSTFDGANPNACTAQRPETTVPQQTLFALNSDFIQDRAATLAALLQQGSTASDSSGDAAPARMVRELYRRCYSREPDDDELTLALQYVNAGTDEAPDEAPDAAQARWQQLAHVLLASNEFVFVD